MAQGAKRAMLVWHRRSGKDKTVLNFLVSRAFERTGTYFYFLPTYRQGKKIIWDGYDKSGFKFLDHVPHDIRVPGGTNETEMQVAIYNRLGEVSIIQFVASDSIDSLVGTNPVGVVFSEFSLMKRKAWDLMRPVLRENEGWAVMIMTPRGKNHAFKMWERVQVSKNWFTSLLTVHDTALPNGEPVVSEDMIQEDREEGMAEEDVQSEYFCSWEGSVVGAYYTSAFGILDKRDAIKDVAWDTDKPVHTAWDIGHDTTSIFFFQLDGNQPRWIDYFESHDEGLEFYAKMLRDKPYVYGTHLGPWDIRHREFTSSASRISRAASLGIHFVAVRKLPIDEGINAVRSLLVKSVFDSIECARGIDCLRNYRRTFNEDLQVFGKSPVHDWASHGADSFRTAAVGLADGQVTEEMGTERQTTADCNFNVYDYAEVG